MWNISIWEQIFSSAIAGTLPVILNYINPYDPRYGNKKKSVMMLKDNIQNQNKVIGGNENGFVGPVPPPPPPPTNSTTLIKK